MSTEPFASTHTGPGNTDTSQHPAPLRHRVKAFALWFGLIGAPLAWAVQLLSAYALSAHMCYPRLVPLAVPELGRTRLEMSLMLIFVVAIAISSFALTTAIGSWRATINESHGDAHVALDVGDGRTRFMSLGGALISALFLLAIVAQGILVLSVQPCSMGIASVR